MMTIQDLLDLSKTIAAPLFAGKTYPWEALADIGDFILQLGPTLPADEYEQRGENIWIARDAKIFDSAYIAGPCIIDHGAELRQCAFIRGNAIVGKNAVVGNSCELKNVVLFDNVQTPHFNAVQVKFAYAVTCHKAQGGQWRAVFVDRCLFVGIAQRMI